MSVTAIIPAYNEEHTIANVIRAIRGADIVREVLVVSDGSTDHTADVARQAGATVIVLEKNHGKGEAMRIGATKTDAAILFFCDGDLLGLTSAHVRAIIAPVMHGNAAMCVGMRDRHGIPMLVARLDPLMAIGGERAVRREIFLSLPRAAYHGYRIEIALNAFCKRACLPVVLVTMRGVNHVVKEKKWGFVRGFLKRVTLITHVLRARLFYFFR